MIDDIDLLRIKRGTKKICRCFEPNMIVDPDSRTVYCGECGAEIEAFEAIKRLAYDGDRWQKRRNMLVDEVAELEKKRCVTNKFRELERDYRTAKMLPCCPNCKEAFEFDDIVSWTGRAYYEAQKAREESNHE